MDPRKQKRLGPAPIASFEKSFEDTTSLTSSVHAAYTTTITTATTCCDMAAADEDNINLALAQGLAEEVKTFNGNGQDDEGVKAKEMVRF